MRTLLTLAYLWKLSVWGMAAYLLLSTLIVFLPVGVNYQIAVVTTVIALCLLAEIIIHFIPRK